MKKVKAGPIGFRRLFPESGPQAGFYVEKKV